MLIFWMYWVNLNTLLKLYPFPFNFLNMSIRTFEMTYVAHFPGSYYFTSQFWSKQSQDNTGGRTPGRRSRAGKQGEVTTVRKDTSWEPLMGCEGGRTWKRVWTWHALLPEEFCLPFIAAKRLQMPKTVTIHTLRIV